MEEEGRSRGVVAEGVEMLEAKAKGSAPEWKHSWEEG